RPVHWIRMTTGSFGRAAAPPLAGRPFAARPFAVPGFPAEPFFFDPERAGVPAPAIRLGALRPGGWRAGDLTAASSSPPRGRADPLRARVAIVTNVASTPYWSQHR